MKKKTYYPNTINNVSTKKPTEPTVGTRYETLVDNQFCDKIFKAGSKVTFLGWTEKQDFGFEYYIWPKFQFDGDTHTRRNLEFSELKKI